MIKGGGDWESIHKYLEEGKDFLTKSESMKIAQPAKQLISVMPKGMDQWLKNNEIKVDWEGANNQERASLKKRFTNRNNPLVKSTGYVKKFESYIEDLIKKGNTGDRERSLPKLIKDSKSNISLGAAQKIITDKNFFVNKSSVDRVFPAMEKRAIELLNQGLPSSEVTKILADEQIIKPRLGEKIGIRPFKNLDRLLQEEETLEIQHMIAKFYNKFDELHEQSVNNALATNPNRDQMKKEIKYRIPERWTKSFHKYDIVDINIYNQRDGIKNERGKVNRPEKMAQFELEQKIASLSLSSKQ